MPAPRSFDYAIIRIVPRVERQEFLNVGVVVFSRTGHFLEVKIDYELARLAAFAPGCELEMVRAQLRAVETVCRGGAEAGYFGTLSQSERFNWLVAPSSTIIQASPVHSGLAENPAEALRALYDLLVARPGSV
ncbi:MAG: DUF3037 domain-containing protein [Calditrichaeota bacterium]|nr:DUF3037 domain-containing protein [Calditrichota bacterium]MCB0291303.1 DUF3037 domain-containing protein [Calditrichota bacterium]MCB9089337.1 DUF3037 domain-containing protein [Calditrichia bacterium]